MSETEHETNGAVSGKDLKMSARKSLYSGPPIIQGRRLGAVIKWDLSDRWRENGEMPKGKRAEREESETELETNGAVSGKDLKPSARKMPPLEPQLPKSAACSLRSSAVFEDDPWKRRTDMRSDGQFLLTYISGTKIQKEQAKCEKSPETEHETNAKPVSGKDLKLSARKNSPSSRSPIKEP
ncbi:hypothetical protein CEXT_652011 [Caerostris extrusa]|uniref:Uncharacterized protein n=1 Tax=Caerostris extrusa TaxID=172846 RepID=A0AAV4WTR0_CAEEX|nr:hypothetical protein CEXT_652011 [Caerostris extrusa]